MRIQLAEKLNEHQLNAWKSLLRAEGLMPEHPAEYTVLLWDDEGILAATGGRDGNIMKYIAVSSAYQGDGLSATVVTELRRNAFLMGMEHLFLFTKPKNQWMFRDLFFYPVAETPDVLLMENKQDGAAQFAASLKKPPVNGPVGAIVMHCDPFTLGHRYLIETAARECERVYVFVLSEDRGSFSADLRMELVRQGTADLEKVVVCPTGPYLISMATFPTYFLKDNADAQNIKCRLDMEIFAKHFAPALGITRRYVGTEPLSPVTDAYNRALREYLPPKGIEVREIPRKTINGAVVSAGAVREALKNGQYSQAAALVPESTWRAIAQMQGDNLSR